MNSEFFCVSRIMSFNLACLSFKLRGISLTQARKLLLSKKWCTLDMSDGLMSPISSASSHKFLPLGLRQSPGIELSGREVVLREYYPLPDKSIAGAFAQLQVEGIYGKKH